MSDVAKEFEIKTVAVETAVGMKEDEFDDSAAALSARVKWPKECKKQRDKAASSHGCPKNKSHPTIKDVDGEVEEAARILVAMSRKAFADAAATFGTGPRCPKGGKKERSKASSSHGCPKKKSHPTIKDEEAAGILMGMFKNAFAVAAAALSTGPRWPKGWKKERSKASSSSSSPHRPRRDQEEPMLLRRQQSEERIRHHLKGCYDIRFLTEKVLTATDVAKKQNRLSFGCSSVPEFLTEEERRSLIEPREVRDYPAIRVRLMIEPSGEQISISLKIWKIGRTPSYVLTTEWGLIVEKHEIVEGETLHILSFRWGDGKLGIALVRSPPEA